MAKILEHFSRRRWTTIPASLVSYSVHEGKHFVVSAVRVLFLKLIYHGAGTVVHLRLHKFSMTNYIIWLCLHWILSRSGFELSVKIGGKSTPPADEKRNNSLRMNFPHFDPFFHVLSSVRMWTAWPHSTNLLCNYFTSLVITNRALLQFKSSRLCFWSWNVNVITRLVKLVKKLQVDLNASNWPSRLFYMCLSTASRMEDLMPLKTWLDILHTWNDCSYFHQRIVRLCVVPISTPTCASICPSLPLSSTLST